MKQRSWFSLIVLALALAACDGIGADGGAGRAATEAGPPPERALPVRVLTVAPRDLSRRVQVAAAVEPLRTIRLAARTEGVLSKVLVEEGDAVRAQQRLARIDVREQQAELARAQARLQERQSQFHRLQQLQARAYVETASVETAAAELAVAASEVDLWQARVDFGTVAATIDGTVVSREIEPGEAIGRHAPLFSIADLSNLVVRVGVSELDAPALQPGDSVLVQVDAVGEHNPLTGRIRRIFPAAEADSRLIRVEIALPAAAELGVRPGYLARVQLLVDRREGVLAVPAAAVATTGGETFVMVVDAQQRLQQRPIEPGILRGNWREVRAGLDPGEQVVDANPIELTAGTLVRIID